MKEFRSGYSEYSARNDAAKTVATMRPSSHSVDVADVFEVLFFPFTRFRFSPLSSSCRLVSCSKRQLTIAAMPERGINHCGAFSL